MWYIYYHISFKCCIDKPEYFMNSARLKKQNRGYILRDQTAFWSAEQLIKYKSEIRKANARSPARMAHLLVPVPALVWSRTIVLGGPEAFLWACECWQAVSGASGIWWAKLEKHGAGCGWEQDSFLEAWQVTSVVGVSPLCWLPVHCTHTHWCGPDTNTDHDRGGVKYSTAWMSMMFSHAVFYYRGRGHLLGYQSWAAHNRKASNIVHKQV